MMKKFIYFVLFSFAFPSCFCGKYEVHRNPMTVANPVYAVNVKIPSFKNSNSILNVETEQFVDRLSHWFYHNEHNATIKCTRSIAALVEDFSQGQRYPLFVLDSWGKLQSGYFYGSNKWLGLYQECLSAQSQNFKPKYCFITVGKMDYENPFIPVGNATLNIGACFPDDCLVEDLTNTFDFFDKNITVSCPKQYTDWSSVDILALVVCILLGVIALTATIIDYGLRQSGQNYFPLDDRNVSPVLSVTTDDISWMISVKRTASDANYWTICALFIAMTTSCLEEFTACSKLPRRDNYCKVSYPGMQQQDQAWLWKFASAFSISRNVERIFNTAQKPEDIHCLHGLRFISISWVILGHSLILMVNFSDNFISLLEYIVNHWEFQAIVNATYAVDTFFFLSGLLVSYLGCRHMVKSGGKMIILKFYLHRYLRLTPLYGFVILMYVSLYLKLVGGPLWPEVIQTSVEMCNKHWYTNLLYINNLYPANVGEECFAISWYLSNDFQFYLFAPLFIFLWYRNPKIGMIVTSLVVLTSVTITGAFSSHTQQQPQAEAFGVLAKFAVSQVFGTPTNLTPAYLDSGQNPYVQDIYTKPWCRIGVYIIGMMSGYFLHVTKCQYKMNKIVVALGWFSSALICCSILYCLYPSFANGYQLSNNTAAFYNAVSRPVWGMCMAWVTIACTTGYGGPVNTFLSWKGFIPLSRLTYALYLVHPLVIWWFLASSDRLFHFNLQTYILIYLGSLMLSVGVALVCALCVEYPFVELARSILKARNTNPVVENPQPSSGEAEED